MQIIFARLTHHIFIVIKILRSDKSFILFLMRIFTNFFIFMLLFLAPLRGSTHNSRIYLRIDSRF